MNWYKLARLVDKTDWVDKKSLPNNEPLHVQCMSCKKYATRPQDSVSKIEEADYVWKDYNSLDLEERQQIDYITNAYNSGMFKSFPLSHGICPECVEIMLGDIKSKYPENFQAL